jgi:hypothetical protein
MDFFDQVSVCQLLKKLPAAWTCFESAVHMNFDIWLQILCVWNILASSSDSDVDR